MVEETFQQKIRNIQRDTNLSSEEKTKKIKDLMINKNKSNTPKPKDNTINLDKNQIGSRKLNIKCEHYSRGCDIYCDICNKYYPCRICYDSY